MLFSNLVFAWFEFSKCTVMRWPRSFLVVLRKIQSPNVFIHHARRADMSILVFRKLYYHLQLLIFKTFLIFCILQTDGKFFVCYNCVFNYKMNAHAIKFVQVQKEEETRKIQKTRTKTNKWEKTLVNLKLENHRDITSVNISLHVKNLGELEEY